MSEQDWNVRPDDRVLLTSLSAIEPVQELLAQLSHGSLVGLGAGGELQEARRRFSAAEHAMFTPGARDDIPWRDHSFTVVGDANPDAPTPEMLRVLKPGGRLLRWPPTPTPEG